MVIMIQLTPAKLLIRLPSTPKMCDVVSHFAMVGGAKLRYKPDTFSWPEDAYIVICYLFF